MAEYWLVTVWRIEAPLTAVYAAVCDPLRWPEWWPDAQRIEERQAGGADGVGQLLRCTWQGRLPYRLRFDLLTTRIQPLVAVEGEVAGDLEGYGRCGFSQRGAVSVIRHEWRVRTTRRWMNLLAPFARVLFRHNHARVMRSCGEGLARRLNARLLSLESTDLASGRRAAERHAAIWAGLAAGVIATAAQVSLWWLADRPVLDTLIRDARLTAAIVAGPAVLPPPNTWEWPVMALATLIHFALSVAYGLLLGRLIRRWPAAVALLAGGLCGLALYTINLYGFTALFPWFAVARDSITAAAHWVFGTALAGSYLLLRRNSAVDG